MIGQQILTYRIESVLGENNTSTVYLAVHQQSGQKAAIRVFNSYVVNQTNLIEHFRKEAATLVSLQHPNLATLYGYAEEPGKLYLISEFIEGTGLAKYMKDASGLPAKDKMTDWFRQLLGAFAQMHQMGVVHGNILPKNILITTDQQIKITGVGIAGLLRDSAQQLAKIGIKVSAISHASPEQVMSKPIDARSDVYSLGVLLFEMLAGYSPYNLETQSEFEIQNRIVNDPLPRMVNFQAGISQRLQAVVDQATAKNPEERYQTGEEFLMAFEASHQQVQEEEADREDQMIAQLMQEVAIKSIPRASDRDNSVIEIARRKSRYRMNAIIASLSVLLIAAFFTVRSDIGKRYIRKGSRIVVNVVSDVSPFRKTSNPIRQTPDVQMPPPIRSETNDSTEQLPPASPVEREKPLKQPAEKTRPQKNDTDQASMIALSNQPETVVEPSAPKVYSKTDIRVRLEQYFEAMRSKNMQALQAFYRMPLSQYYEEANVSSRRLRELVQESWENIPEETHDILWETFNYERDDAGNYVVDFYMNYNFRQADSSLLETQKMYVVMKMNKELKIFYLIAG